MNSVAELTLRAWACCTVGPVLWTVRNCSKICPAVYSFLLKTSFDGPTGSWTGVAGSGIRFPSCLGAEMYTISMRFISSTCSSKPFIPLLYESPQPISEVLRSWEKWR